MHLSSMLEREDFFSVFFKTLKQYYSEVYDQQIEIDFSNKKECNLVIKKYLSAATSPNISSKARSFFYSEWNIRKSFTKYIIAKLGVFILTHSYKAFSQYQFKFTPNEIVTRNLVIAPNNRSIRIFDYETNTVGCIIKDGFTDKYFKNQLEFRKNNKYSFVLPMQKYGDTWFIERIMQGHPLARVTNNRVYKKGVFDALEGIKQLASDTLLYIDAETYISDLFNNIKNLIKQAVTRKKITTSECTITIAEKCMKNVLHNFKSIPTCISHGDFQSGNIWVDTNEKTWIYDWETVCRRSVWYDSSVLCYSLRRANGWNDFSKKQEPSEILKCDSKDMYSTREYNAIKSVVMIEDIVFYLEDMMELPNDWGNKIYDAFINRISLIEI